MLLLLALTVRLGLSLSRDQWPFSTDEHHWERLGALYAVNGLLSDDPGTHRPPAYPLLIATVYHFLGDEPLHVRLVQSFLALIVVFQVYRIARRVSDEENALLAAALASFYPLWCFVNAMLMAETLLVALVVSSVLFSLRWLEQGTFGRGATLGITLGLGFLCKPIVIAWAGCLIMGLWFKTVGAPLSERLNSIGVIFCGVLLAVVPWTIRNEVVTGHRLLVSSNFGMNLMIGHEAGARGYYQNGRDYLTIYDRIGPATDDAVEKDKLVAREIGNIIAENPARSAWLGVKKVYWFWNSLLGDGPRWARTLHLLLGTVVVVAGGVGLYRMRQEELAWIVGLASIVWTLIHAVFFSHAKFRLPVDMLLLPFAAISLQAGFCSVRQAVTRRLRELDTA